LYSHRLIEISIFLTEKFEDIGEIKESIETSGERLSELHMTMQKNYQKAEKQAAENTAQLLHTSDRNQEKTDEHFLRLEKIEQSKDPYLIRANGLTGDRKTERENPPVAGRRGSNHKSSTGLYCS